MRECISKTTIRSKAELPEVLDTKNLDFLKFRYLMKKSHLRKGEKCRSKVIKLPGFATCTLIWS